MQGGARTLDVVASAKSFASLLLPPHIERALREAGFRRPSPVQEAALPLARMGADVIVQAKAGTGKTLVFAIAAVERVDMNDPLPQALILAPTREIALQASEAVAMMAAALPPPGVACGSFIGGLPVEEDEKQLRRACHVAVGTTGRVLSLIQRGALRTGSVRMLVLDEADKLLGDSFRKDVLAIAGALPATRQTLALSATYAPGALDQLRRLMHGKQQEVRLCAGDTSLLGVHQTYRFLPTGTGSSSSAAAAAAASEQQEQRDGTAAGGGNKDGLLEARVAALLRLLSAVSFQQAVVFCKYTADAEEAVERLAAAGYPAAYLSGQRSQLQRIEALNALRDFRARVAVSTDLAARGVDLDLVNLVINLELPGDAATYMHRVGRAGRFGTRGVAVTLLQGPDQLGRLRGLLEEVAGGQVTELPEHIPEGWYHQQPIPGAATSAPHNHSAHSMAASAGMGPDTPASHTSPLAASLAAVGSLGAGDGPLSDIATASLWLGEDGDEEGGAESDSGSPALVLQGRQAWQQEANGAPDVDVSYTVVPKPAARSGVAAAAANGAAEGAGSAAAAAGAATKAGGKHTISSLTAAVAAAEASSREQGHAPGAPSAAALAACDSSLDSSLAGSEGSWDSSSDEEDSVGSGSEAGATLAPPCNGRTASRHIAAGPYGLRRVGSAHSAGSGSGSSGGSSGGSGRLSSPPAPIPGRAQHPAEGPAKPLWQNSYEEGSGLAEAAAAVESDAAVAAADEAGQHPAHHCRSGSASGEEEPSFKDSWLSEEQQQEDAAQRQRARQAEAAQASNIELRPHRRATKPAAADAAHAAHQLPKGKQKQLPPQAQPAAQQAGREAQPQGHYWDVVRSVQKDVCGRMDGITAAKPGAAAPVGSALAGAASAADADHSSDDESYAPVVPRQRRPLGSAQLSATRRRHDETAASVAAEAAALERMAEHAEQEAAEEEEAGDGQPAADVCPSDDAGAAAAGAAAAEQQRQWSEFWMQHYAYYGCYPSEGLFSAEQPAGSDATAAAAAAAPTAVATLPPPPPSPPAPPPLLSAAGWACQPPAGAELHNAAAHAAHVEAPPGGAAAARAPSGASGAAAGAGSPASAGEGWVAVPAALLARYQQLEWQSWHRQYSEWQSTWEQYKQYWSSLYSQQEQLDPQQLQYHPQ